MSTEDDLAATTYIAQARTRHQAAEQSAETQRKQADADEQARIEAAWSEKLARLSLLVPAPLRPYITRPDNGAHRPVVVPNIALHLPGLAPIRVSGQGADLDHAYIKAYYVYSAVQDWHGDRSRAGWDEGQWVQGLDEAIAAAYDQQQCHRQIADQCQQENAELVALKKAAAAAHIEPTPSDPSWHDNMMANIDAAAANLDNALDDIGRNQLLVVIARALVRLAADSA